MSQYLTPEVTTLIITAIVIPFFVQITRYITKLICTKVDELQTRLHNDTVNHLIDHAEDAVITAVDSVSQTFVNSLKNDGKFDQDSAKQAFGMAKDKAISMLGNDAKVALNEAHGDIDSWIENKIETYVKANKQSPI